MDEDGTITDVVSRGEVRGGCDALECISSVKSCCWS